MIFAGVDMGSLTTKVVLLDDNQILSARTITSADEGELRARKALAEALNGSLDLKDIAYIVTTGVGRRSISFAQKQKSLSTCLARGVDRLFPTARTVVDVGAETCTVVRINQKGLVEDSVSNERCASGTGVFLESVAKLMRLKLEEMAQASLLAGGKAEITNMCAIFAEQEIISHVHRNPPTPKNDIIAGVHASMATRVGGLAKKVGIKADVAFTGGVARNIGFVRALEENLGLGLLVPDDPQLVAALGAACIARDEGLKKP
jgi:predicted CoA-substrate-specific enzyme activase